MPEFTASLAPLPLPATALLPESASAPVLNVAAARAARAAAGVFPFSAAHDDNLHSEQRPNPQQSTQTNPDQKPLPPPKKPRVWSSMFRRRPTTLGTTAAESANRNNNASTHGIITSQAEFRRNFLKVHKDRVLRDNKGNCFRMHPILMNGDCGFGAIAKGINLARDRVRDIAARGPDDPPTATTNGQSHPPSPHSPRQHPQSRHRRPWRRMRPRPWTWPRLGPRRALERSAKSLQAKDIRKAMYDELRKARKTYLDDCEDFTGVFTNDDFDKLEREVSHPGIAGHWLGTVLGVLEHVILAQAMNINIFLYQFDLQRQCIRQFESATVANPDCEVYLFFTGPASCGHFDTLVKITDPRANLFMA